MEKLFKFKLGDEVADRVTGFKGIVACRSQYFSGCNRYAIQSQKLKDNKPSEWQHFDEDQLKLTGKSIKMIIKNPGGKPREEAPRR